MSSNIWLSFLKAVRQWVSSLFNSTASLCYSKDSYQQRQSLTRAQIVELLKGESFVLPNFSRLYHPWPVSVSPNLEKLKIAVAQRNAHVLAEIQSPQSTFHYSDIVRQRKKLDAMNLAYFVSTWWPESTFNTQLLMSQLVLWLFIWDDEVDSNNSTSSFGQNWPLAQQYRHETLSYLQHVLRLTESSTVAVSQATLVNDITQNRLITSFAPIAEALVAQPTAHRVRMYRELEIFIESTATEQIMRSQPHLSDIDKCISTRLKTLAVRPLYVLYDALTASAVPQYNTSSLVDVECDNDETQKVVAAHLGKLIDETIILIALTNDVFSCQKELADGDIDSLIPVLWLETGSVQKAVDSAMELLYAARYRFDNIEREIVGILKRSKTNGTSSIEHERRVKEFIEMSKMMAAGHVDWSMKSKRYGLDKMSLSARTIML